MYIHSNPRCLITHVHSMFEYFHDVEINFKYYEVHGCLRNYLIDIFEHFRTF